MNRLRRWSIAALLGALCFLNSSFANAAEEEFRSIRMADGRTLVGVVLESTSVGMRLLAPQGEVMIPYSSLVGIGVIDRQTYESAGPQQVAVAPCASSGDSTARLNHGVDRWLKDALSPLPGIVFLGPSAWKESLYDQGEALSGCEGDWPCIRGQAVDLDAGIVLLPTLFLGSIEGTYRLEITGQVVSTGEAIGSGQSLLGSQQTSRGLTPTPSGAEAAILRAGLQALGFTPRVDLASLAASSGAVVTPDDAKSAEEETEIGSERSNKSIDPILAAALGTQLTDPKTDQKINEPEATEDKSQDKERSTELKPGLLGLFAKKADEPATAQAEASPAVKAEGKASPSGNSVRTTEVSPSPSPTPTPEAKPEPKLAESSSPLAWGDSDAYMTLAPEPEPETADSNKQDSSPKPASQASAARSASPKPKTPKTRETKPKPAGRASDLRASSRTTAPPSKKQSLAIGLGFLPVPGLSCAILGNLPCFGIALGGTVAASWGLVYLIGATAETAPAFWSASLLTPYALSVSVNQITGAISADRSKTTVGSRLGPRFASSIRPLWTRGPNSAPQTTGAAWTLEGSF